MEPLQVRIPDIFNGRKILVTGFSGFVGKALVEKLLYSCPNITTIYVTIRSKRGKCVEERLKKIFESSCFTRLRTERPGFAESKIVPLVSDICQPNIGLSEDDMDTVINNVSIIYHIAADVKFTQPLSEAVNNNTKSTFHMIELAKRIRNLECFLYVSTAFSNCYNLNIKEEVYTPLADWKTTLEICDKVDSTVLQVLTEKYTHGMPNTYVYSKHLSESIVHAHRGDIPVVIMRPPVVMAAVKEPLPGWFDNLYGPGMIYLGFASGMMKHILLREEVNYNAFAVDYITSGTIIASVHRIVNKETETNVYNCCMPDECRNSFQHYKHLFLHPVTLQDLKKEGYPISRNYFFTSKFWFTVHFFYEVMFTAYFIDGLLTLFGQEPRLVKLRRKIYVFSLKISFFLLNNIYIESERYDCLPNTLLEEDRKDFYYSVSETDVDKAFEVGYFFVKEHYLNKIMRKPNIMRYLHIIKYLDLFFCCATYYITGFSLYWALKSFYLYLESNFSLF